MYCFSSGVSTLGMTCTGLRAHHPQSICRAPGITHKLDQPLPLASPPESHALSLPSDSLCIYVVTLYYCRDQNALIRNTNGHQTDRWLTSLASVMFGCLPVALLGIAAVSRLNTQALAFDIVIMVIDDKWWAFGVSTTALWLCMFATIWLQGVVQVRRGVVDKHCARWVGGLLFVGGVTPITHQHKSRACGLQMLAAMRRGGRLGCEGARCRSEDV